MFHLSYKYMYRYIYSFAEKVHSPCCFAVACWAVVFHHSISLFYFSRDILGQYSLKVWGCVTSSFEKREITSL